MHLRTEMVSICEKNKCTGCAACMNICGHSAIHMEESVPFGYVYPVIDTGKCVDCGLCAKICPANAPVGLNKPLRALSAISKDHNDLMTSASGGASSVLSKVILERGGVVYGCVQRNYKDIAHRRIDKLSDVHKLKGSKYVQSDIGYIYREVKKDLKGGKEVLFSGTPCQIAGLKAFLNVDYTNLYLVDLVCHGVPSQKLLREDVDSLLRDFPCVDKNNVCVEFRQKKRECQERFEPNYGTFLSNCGSGNVGIGSPSKKKKQKFLRNNYITAFMAGIILRDSCYVCPYAQNLRCGDITIADFWGLKGENVPTKEGVSLLIASTEKGLKLIDCCKKYFCFEYRPVEEAIKGNGRLQCPSIRPEEKDDFVSLYPHNKRKAYNQSLGNYRKNYHYRIVRPSIYEKYERMVQSNLLFKVLDRIPKFKGVVLRCAYAYAQYKNILPE